MRSGLRLGKLPNQSDDSRAHARSTYLIKTADEVHGRAAFSAMFLRHRRSVRSVFEERSDLDAKPLRYFEKSAGADPICAGLVFLNLLIGNFESPRELFLRHAKQISSFPNLPADMIVDSFR